MGSDVARLHEKFKKPGEILVFDLYQHFKSFEEKVSVYGFVTLVVLSKVDTIGMLCSLMTQVKKNLAT